MIIINGCKIPYIDPILPDGLRIDHEKNRICDEDGLFCNGLYQIGMVFDACDNDKKRRMIELVFRISYIENIGEDHVTRVKKISRLLDMADVKKGNILKDFPNDLQFCLTDLRKLDKLICESILQVTVKLNSFTKAYILHQGFNFLPNGRVVCLLGDKPLNADENECYIFEPEYKLKPYKIDEHSNEFIKILLEESGFPKILLMVIIAAMIRPFVPENIRDDYDFILFLEGPTDSGKSSIVELLLGIFCDEKNKNSNIIQISSDFDDICNCLNRIIHFCVSVDDYYLDMYTYIGKQITNTLNMIINNKQVYGNVLHKGKKHMLEPITIITARDHSITPNIAARCVVVELLKRFDSNIMYYLRANRESYIGWIVSLATWICQNPDTVKKCVIEAFGQIEMKADEMNLYSGWYHSMNTKRFLYAAVKVFYRFFYNGQTELPIFNHPIFKVYESVDYWIDYTLDLNKEDMSTSQFANDFARTLLDSYDEYGTEDLCLFRNSTKKRKLTYNGIYYDKKSDLYYIRNTHMIELLNDEYDCDYNKESLPIDLAAEGLIVTKEKKNGGTERTFKKLGCSCRLLMIYGDKIHDLGGSSNGSDG